MSVITANRTGNCLTSIAVIFALCSGLIERQARADWTVIGEAQLDNPDQKTVKQPLMFQVRDKTLRIDIGNGMMSIIIDTKSGDKVMLMHVIKGYQKLSAKDAKSMSEKAGNYSEKAPPKASPTGKKSTINGYDVQEYVTESPDRKQIFWLSKDVPHYAELRDLTMAYVVGADGNLTVDPTSLPGYPIKIEMDVTTHKLTSPKGESIDIPATKIVQNITSVKEAKLDNSVFDIPQDYKEIPSPKQTNDDPQP